MGWAKYYEDNLSIYINRMVMKEQDIPSIRVRQFERKPVINQQNTQIKTVDVKNKNSRVGIMVFFDSVVNNSLARKLQMNGWWFSKSNNCWCNYNNKANRQYVQRMNVRALYKDT